MRANDKAIAFGLSFGVLSGFDRIKPGQFHVAYATGNCPRHLDEKESLGVGGTNPEAPVQALATFGREMRIMLCYALKDLCSAGIVQPRSKG
jgi:hypothetical protein